MSEEESRFIFPLVRFIITYFLKPSIFSPPLKNHQNVSVALTCVLLLFGMVAQRDK